ncbi:5-azacytidine resistance protein-like protein azr1 [Dothidotthia symphoricarpi CBS 119687]|uniref:Protein phosphatase n=1 Tax=Dothidotthia symphoricarpi CBS 119687 TaxID=1392245 RepID=A0A6A6ANV7_9PLEO|nr:5-azacytidine resistance protein-like protein azr1 [Dothidotthia symphoricarpi CBS 119687]KAF2132577.1 5-azacytidine resistance protein-like protein azr1 [Dothidotthia symphoricarpi CBS 119687]
MGGLGRLQPTSGRAGLFLFALSASSLVAPAHASRTAGFHSLRAPTCPLHRDTSPAPLGLRSFHATSHSASTTPHFSYHVAASYSAKQDRFNADANLFTRPLYDPAKSKTTDLKTCKQSIDQRKRVRSGQDALFFSQVGNTEATTFGVADGVGGWVESGLDPADFSHGLCEYMACFARSWPHGSNATSLHPRDLLQVAYDQVTDDETIEGGGSTACLAVAEPDGNVEVANLGDSGFMHLGLNAVRHFTQPQTHAFNTPYQLSKTPQRMLVQMAIFGGSASLSDMPKESSVTHHRVRHGDVLVFATDGVWDNLSPQDALGIVSRQMVDLGAWVEKDGTIEVGQDLAKLVQSGSGRRADSSSLQAKVATAIAKQAKVTGLNTRRDGPFAREVQKHYPGENWHGGKPDDIAAVVAIVLEGSA